MALRKGLPAKLAATDANDTRYDFRALVATTSAGNARGGVVSPPWQFIGATSAMSVTVDQFSAVAARDGGAVLLSNDGQVTVTLAAAPSSNSRIDLIYAKQNDASSTVTTPDANNTAVIDKVTGTAAASPVKPALPVGAVELGTVLIPANVTATNQGGVVISTSPTTNTAAAGGYILAQTRADLRGTGTGGTGLLLDAPDYQRVNVAYDPTWYNNGGYMRSGGGGDFVPIEPATRVDTALVGSNVGPGNLRFIQQAGIANVTTNASGDVGLPFASPFPNGVAFVAIQRINYATLGPTTEVAASTQSLAQYNFRIYQANGTALPASQALSYSYMAFGW